MIGCGNPPLRRRPPNHYAIASKASSAICTELESVLPFDQAATHVTVQRSERCGRNPALPQSRRNDAFRKDGIPVTILHEIEQ